MHHANLEKLKSLRLFGMVRALQELTGLDDRGRLDFDDQLALLIERETADRTFRPDANASDVSSASPRGKSRGEPRDGHVWQRATVPVPPACAVR